MKRARVLTFAKTAFGGICALACACAIALLLALMSTPSAAWATSVGELHQSYKLAVTDYQLVLEEQEQAQESFEQIEEEIEALEVELEDAKEELQQSSVTLYKLHPGRARLIDRLLGSASIDEALACLDDYEHIERAYLKALLATKQKRDDLQQRKTELAQKRAQIAFSVKGARLAAEKAQAAWHEASHVDGADFHQRQGVDVNCGATSFTVGVNILLHEVRFPDNVAVWQGAGFNGNSTTDLAGKGAMWLAANGLSDQISCESIMGDIRTVDQMKSELEQGNVVIVSSGSGSVWRYADGSAVPGLFPDGHWIVFYRYADGIFYANDSSVEAKRGAGCPYSEEDLQQWLNGRGNHFAVRLCKRS